MPWWTWELLKIFGLIWLFLPKRHQCGWGIFIGFLIVVPVNWPILFAIPIYVYQTMGADFLADAVEAFTPFLLLSTTLILLLIFL